MKNIRYTLAIAVAITTALALSAFAAEKTPPGSFLRYRATSVKELNEQLAKDKTVRARYTRHFGLPAEQISAFFSDNLKLVTLKSPLKVQMWYVGKDDKIHKKSKLLPKGTAVFATADGRPVLSWSCGNPVRSDLPIAQAKKPTQQPVAAATASAQESVQASSEVTTPQPEETATVVQPDPDTLVAANPIDTIAAAAITSVPMTATAAAIPVTAPVVVEAAAVPAIAVPPVVAAGTKLGLGWLGALGGAAGVAAIVSGGGGSEPGPPPPVVPEPSTMAALATGLFGTMSLGLRQLRIRR